MTSTNDGKDVKSDQTSGHKGKSYYIDLYKSLEKHLSEECELRERTRHLCEAWRRVHSLCQHSAPTTHPHYLAWLQRHTANTLLQSEWQSQKDEHTKLQDAIETFFAESEAAIAKRNGQSPVWEAQLLQRGQWFKKILGNPWGHPVLKVLCDPRGTPPSDEDILEWLKEERGVMFVTRIRHLAASRKCHEIALSLATAVMDRKRATEVIIPDAEQADEQEPPTSESKTTFKYILRLDAGFTVDVWEMLTDLELVLLHKRDEHAQCIALAKKIPLRSGYQLVERLRSRPETSPREKKLWKNAGDVATLVAQVLITRCMVVPSCGGVVRSALYCCARSLVRAVPRARLPAAAAALAAPAATARHLHTLAAAVHKQMQAQQAEDMNSFVCELYVRAITAGMNELEKLKLKTEKEPEARGMEQTLAGWFTSLGALLAGSARIHCECALTAFSVHPAAPLYDKVRAAPPLPHDQDKLEPKEETTSEFGSWANDSRSQTNLVKTSETLNLKKTQQHTNVMSTAIFAEGEAIGLSADLCQDLMVCLSGPRVKTLAWDMDREVLLENCRTYMERTQSGTRALTTELKYLNLDPSHYQHLPEEEDDENDVYYGIEKGYEHLVELQEEVSWQESAMFADEATETAYSSSMEFDDVPVRRKKKSKRIQPLYSEDDSDPLSTVAEANKGDKKKERPHSKERSKEKKKKPKDPESKEKRKYNKKKERKKEKVAVAKPGSLASLIGVKVTRKDETEFGIPPISDSDYDSQGKSSLASDGNDPSVVFDGLFSMDDPLVDKQLASAEVSITNGKVAVKQAPKPKSSVTKRKPKITTNTTTDTKPVTGAKFVNSLKLDTNRPRPSAVGVVSEQVKRSITKLLQFRRNQNSGLLNRNAQSNAPKVEHKPANAIFKPDFPSQPFISPKSVIVPEIPKSYINKTSLEQSNDDRNQYYNHLNANEPVRHAAHRSGSEHNLSMQSHSKSIVDRVPPPSTSTSARTSPVNKYKDILNVPSYYQNTNYKPYHSASASPKIVPNNHSSVEPKHISMSLSRVETPRPQEQSQSYEEFLKELKTAANPPVSTSVIVKKERVSRPPIGPSVPNAGLSISPQCAKQVSKKVENAPNTFSRLSYMKNKQSDMKQKQALEAQASRQEEWNKQALAAMDLARCINEFKNTKVKYIQTKGETVITRVDNPLNLSCDNVNAVRKVEKSPSTNKSHPVMSNLLQTTTTTPQKSVCRNDNVTATKVIAPTPETSYLSDKDQNDLLLLLRQQNRINAIRTAPKDEIHPQNPHSQVNMTSDNLLPAPACNNVITKPVHAANLKKCSHYDMASGSKTTRPEVKHENSVINYSKVAHTFEHRNNTVITKSSGYVPKNTHKESDKLDWEKVMNAIRAQKTPSRGPSALELALKGCEDSKDKNLRNQRIVRTNSTGKADKNMKTVDGLIKPVKNTTKTPSASLTKDLVKTTQDIQNRTVVVKTTQADNLNTLVVENKKAVKNIPPKIPVEEPDNNQMVADKNKFAVSISKNKDPFISGRDDDYNLSDLDDLLDDELRRELGELSSDEDSYRMPQIAKGMKIVSSNKFSNIKEVSLTDEALDVRNATSLLHPSSDQRRVVTEDMSVINRNYPKSIDSSFDQANKIKTKATVQRNLPNHSINKVTCNEKLNVNFQRNDKLVTEVSSLSSRSEYKNATFSNMSLNKNADKVKYIDPSLQQYSTALINTSGNKDTTTENESVSQTTQCLREQFTSAEIPIQNTYVIDATKNIYITVPPPTPNLLLIGSEMYFNQIPTVKCQLKPNLCAVSQTYVPQNNAQNIILTQATELSAPIVASPVSTATTQVKANDDKSSHNEIDNNNLANSANSNPECINPVNRSDQLLQDVNSNMENKVMFDIISDRRVLSEVQEIEKQEACITSATLSTSRSLSTEEVLREIINEAIDENVSDDIFNNIGDGKEPYSIKDAERLKSKRLAILNREIIKSCIHPTIALSYAPLCTINIHNDVCPKKQEESIDINKLEVLSQEIMTPLINEENLENSHHIKKVEKNISQERLLTNNGPNEGSSDEHSKENTAQCRRILLRSSNKPSPKRSNAVNVENPVIRKSKVRLKVQTEIDKKDDCSKMEVIKQDGTIAVKRNQKKKRKATVTKKSNKVVNVTEEHATNSTDISPGTTVPVNSNSFDIEDALLGSLIPNINLINSGCIENKQSNVNTDKANKVVILQNKKVKSRRKRKIPNILRVSSDIINVDTKTKLLRNIDTGVSEISDNQRITRSVVKTPLDNETPENLKGGLVTVGTNECLNKIIVAKKVQTATPKLNPGLICDDNKQEQPILVNNVTDNIQTSNVESSSDMKSINKVAVTKDILVSSEKIMNVLSTMACSKKSEPLTDMAKDVENIGKQTFQNIFENSARMNNDEISKSTNDYLQPNNKCDILENSQLGNNESKRVESPVDTAGKRGIQTSFNKNNVAISNKTSKSLLKPTINDKTLKATENNSLKSSIPQSYKDSIIIEEIPNVKGVNNVSKLLRVKLPNGKVFKASVYGKMHTSFDSLFEEPAIRSMLMSELNDQKKYTLNIKQVSTPNKQNPDQPMETRIQEIHVKSKNLAPAVIETIDLLSDDEECDKNYSFKTMSGVYRTTLKDTGIIAKHQAKLDQNCCVKLDRLVIPQIVNDSNDMAPILDFIQIDGDSDDETSLPPVFLNTRNDMSLVVQTTENEPVILDKKIDTILPVVSDTLNDIATPIQNTQNGSFEENDEPNISNSNVMDESSNDSIDLLKNVTLDKNIDTISPVVLDTHNDIITPIQNTQNGSSERLGDPNISDIMHIEESSNDSIHLLNNVTLDTNIDTISPVVLDTHNDIITPLQNTQDGSSELLGDPNISDILHIEESSNDSIHLLNNVTLDTNIDTISPVVLDTHNDIITPIQNTQTGSSELIDNPNISNIMHIEESSNESIDLLKNCQGLPVELIPGLPLISNEKLPEQSRDSTDTAIINSYENIGCNDLQSTIKECNEIKSAEEVSVTSTGNHDNDKILMTSFNCYVSLTKCDDLVKKYNYLNALNKSCSINLERCDSIPDSSRTIDDYSTDIFDTSNDITDAEGSTNVSASILNDYSLISDIDNESKSEDGRNSPVIEVFEAIASLCNKNLANKEIRTVYYETNFECEWLVTKRQMRQDIKYENENIIKVAQRPAIPSLVSLLLVLLQNNNILDHMKPVIAIDKICRINNRSRLTSNLKRKIPKSADIDIASKVSKCIPLSENNQKIMKADAVDVETHGIRISTKQSECDINNQIQDAVITDDITNEDECVFVEDNVQCDTIMEEINKESCINTKMYAINKNSCTKNDDVVIPNNIELTPKEVQCMISVESEHEISTNSIAKKEIITLEECCDSGSSYETEKHQEPTESMCNEDLRHDYSEISNTQLEEKMSNPNNEDNDTSSIGIEEKNTINNNLNLGQEFQITDDKNIKMAAKNNFDDNSVINYITNEQSVTINTSSRSENKQISKSNTTLDVNVENEVKIVESRIASQSQQSADIINKQHFHDDDSINNSIEHTHISELLTSDTRQHHYTVQVVDLNIERITDTEINSDKCDDSNLAEINIDNEENNELLENKKACFNDEDHKTVLSSKQDLIQEATDNTYDNNCVTSNHDNKNNYTNSNLIEDTIIENIDVALCMSTTGLEITNDNIESATVTTIADCENSCDDDQIKLSGDELNNEVANDQTRDELNESSVQEVVDENDEKHMLHVEHTYSRKVRGDMNTESQPSNFKFNKNVEVNEAVHNEIIDASDSQDKCLLRGFQFEDPDVGTLYVLYPIDDSSSETDTLNESSEGITDRIEEVEDLNHAVNSASNSNESPETLRVKIPRITYSKQYEDNTKLKKNLKRKIDFTDAKTEKKYRKGKNIDYPKITTASIVEQGYTKEYKRVFDYSSSIKFSYTQPFHKDYLDIDYTVKDWPIKGPCLPQPELAVETESNLFTDIETKTNYEPNPMEQSLEEEMNQDYTENKEPSSDINETNFNMGFGEGSGRVIQNLEDVGDISKVSAATLSDVKQPQPFLLSENFKNIQMKKPEEDDQIEKIQHHLKFMKLRETVKTFFQNNSIKLECNRLNQEKKNVQCDNQLDASSFPFDLYIQGFLEPPPFEAIVQVVQVGQLPVSAAAQNPVTCDPRVTQVSDASPSQCSADSSPHDDSSTPIKTEYTELTTADLTLPLVQDYVQHTQTISMESHENQNIPVSEENIPIETEIKSVVKIELMEELPEEKEELPDLTENIEPQTTEVNHTSNDEYSYEAHNTVATYDTENTNNSYETENTDTSYETNNADTSYETNNADTSYETNNADTSYETNNAAVTPLDDANMQMMFNSTDKPETAETYPQQTEQNGVPEKTDQIAHAMSAAGITTAAETIANNRAQALVNMISQKIRQGAVGGNTTTANSYPKTTPINAMALQQALAQILPPPLNQTNVNDNNQQTSNAQVLHIVQGKNAGGSQITLVDNSQQSVISGANSTPLLHIVQNKAGTPGVTANGTPGAQANSFSGLSLVDAGLQQGGNQLLHIVNTGSQKNNNAGQLLKRVNLLTNLANVQGSNEQKMVQFVCKSADGKSIQLNAPHQRSMVLRLQPIESPAPAAQTKPGENQELNQSPGANKDSASQQEIKSRSVYEENYAKFIQNSSTKPAAGAEKSTSLPKFNQAFGKPVFQEGTQKSNEISNNMPSVNTPSDNNECQPNDNAINLEHISQISSPPLLLRKSPAQTSQAQTNLVQQIKQTIAPMNIQTMHGGVIYTRQIPVNIGGGQTINLITVPSTELIDESGQKQQSDLEQSIIKIVPQNEGSTEDGNNTGASNENNQNPQPQQVLTQMRIKLPMLSKTPQMVSGGRVVRPSFFQIQRNVIGGANQPVYQQLVLTAAPPLGQQTIRLPTANRQQLKVPSESQSTESMSSSTLEQLREFDMVLEQVKERSTVQPNSNAATTFPKLHTPSTDTTDGATPAATTPSESTQVLYSIGNNQSLNVAYVNRKATVATPTTSNFVRSPDSSGIADSPTSSTHSQIPHTVTTESTSSETPSQPKAAKVGSKSRSRPKSSSHAPSSMKINPVPPKTSTQKPLEDEQTTQRILYILAEYKEQVENSPDKDKPAPRRRSNPPSNPGSSKRKKSSSGSRRHGRDMSPIHGDETCRTMGSEDSSCGTSQGDCNESCLDSHSPQDSPRKIVRKLTFEQETPVQQPRPQPQRNVIVADGQTITVARGTAGKPATAVLMPANYILPVSMVKGGQQIAIVTNRGPKLLTVGGEAGATNALLLQRLIGPAGLKPMLARPGVRHVRLPTAALHNLQAFNLATATTVLPPDSTASPAPAPPELIETRATSSPWADRESQDVKPERGSSPEGSEPWNLPSSADPHDYIYEETVRADNMDRTVLDPIPDRYSPDMEAQRIFDKMFDVDPKKSYIVDSPRCGYDIDASDCDDKTYHQVVHKKDGTSQRHHRLTHVSAAALRHKYAILEHELRLQKSLSEECEDLGVDSPSASELFPEAELLFAASPAHDHTQEQGQHSHTPQPTHLNQSSIPHPDMDDQIATDQLLPREDIERQQLELGLEDVGIVSVTDHGMQAIALDHEEFARAHPNTTFHSEPSDDAPVQPFTIAGLKGRHITSTIFHSNRAPATVLMTAPQTTVISQAAAEPVVQNVKYSDIDNMINSLPSTHNNINLSSVLVKDDGLTRFDNILNDSRELHLTNTASAIVHSTGNATQVIRRVCYDDKRDRDTSFLMDEPDALIAGDDAKMIAEDSSRDATMESMADVDDDRSSPERHTELFWESNSASERSDGRRPLDFSSDSDKCCKSPSYDETNSTDSSGVGPQLRLHSVIQAARGRACGSADGSSDDAPPPRTYPAARCLPHSVSGKVGCEPDGRRRASGRGVVKRGCHCCSGEPAPPRNKRSRQRKPNVDFAN